MSVSSNIYATKIFSEHPISLFALDDDVSYISLITDEQRLFESDSPYPGWTVTNGDADDSLTLPSLPSPFLGGPYGGIAGDVPLANDTNIEWKSPTLFQLSDLNQELETFSISCYLYQNSTLINWYEVGYLAGTTEHVTRIEAPDRPAWINFDFTYLPEFYNSDEVKIIIRANVDLTKGTITGEEADYRFIVNGLSIGQWSETTSSKSLGAIPEDTNLGWMGVPASEYGINKNPGYYIVENNRLLAKNEGTPLVFGSENITRIYPAEQTGTPSLILPGRGFLFEANRYGQYTAEFWLKADPNTEEFKRIFGPIDNDYGIYVNNGFISLVVGNNFGSHPVSEWYRTMLIQIILGPTEVSLFINGESVITIPFDRNSIELPFENNWLGFYSDPKINILEIDCFSIYSYLLPLQVAKRRFVYGQGTDSPQAISSSFQGTTSYIDFSNANYTANTIYPDIANWNAGYKNNLVSTKSSISMPNYSLPLITVVNRDIQELYEQNKNTNEQVGETFFTFRPFAPSTENLIINGYFDENVDGWEKINETSVTKTFDNSRNENVMRVASFNTWQKILSDEIEVFDWENWDGGDWEDILFFENNSFFAGAKLTERIPILPNVEYRFSVDVKRIVGNSDDPYIEIKWFDSSVDGNQIGTTFQSLESSIVLNKWENIRVSATSPSGSSYAELSIYMSNSEIEEGEVQLFDNALFIPLELNWTEPGYMFFNNLNFVERMSSFYGVFSSRDLISYSPLVVIKNLNGFSEFKIILENNFIKYMFNNEVLYEEKLEFESSGTDLGTPYDYSGFYEEYLSFAVGINIKEFAKNYGYSVANFFQSPELLQMYISGDTINTFYDRFYKFGFCNNANNQEIENYFLDNGVVDRFEFEKLNNHFASYTLTPLNRFDRFFMDISVSSVWEEYFPLTTFAGFIKNIDGDLYYDVDMLQINLGYAPVTEIVEEIIRDLRWTYAELFQEFNIPIQKSYNILNNPELSGYEIYEDLDFKIVNEFFLNTEKSSLRGYITFQSLVDGANELISNFPYYRKLLASQVIDAELENSTSQPYRSYLTKFEFIDKTIVFPPKKLNFKDIAMVVHFDIKQEGILSNPLRVRDFEITSRALSQYDFNPIGTEYGTPVFPFVKSGVYFDNKEKNPMLISKRRFPYLYLTKDSGIQLLGNQTLDQEYSVAIPINQQRAPDYSVGSVNLWMKFDRVEFPTTSYPIFEIQGSEKTIEFVIRTDASGKRGVVVARDKQSKILEPGITFYQNGIRVKSPIVEINQWNSIGISFDTPILFNQSPGYITFFRGISFHNVAYFKSQGLGESLKTSTRIWSKVLSDDDIDNFSWATWYAGSDLVVTQTRTNIAYNPSAEIDATGWTPTGGGMTVERITSDYRFGDASIRCISSASNNSGVLFGNLSGSRISVDSNKEYTASAYVRIPEGSPSKTLRFRIRQYSSVTGGSILPIINSTQLFNFSDSDGWVRIFFTFTTGTSTNAVGIEVSQQTGNISGDEFYVDALLLEESATLFPKVNRYFDGSTSAGGLLSQSLTWNGSPHNSSSTTIYYVPSEDQIKQWLDVYVLDQSLTYVLTPEQIYKTYVGTNQIIVDDDMGLIVDSDSVANIVDVQWNRISGKPA